MNKLSINNLSFERDDVAIFENLSADWGAGDIVQLVGHNGAGKSTLMKLIAGLLQPFSGSITWNDYSVSSHEFKSSLTYLGHAVGVKATMTPFENLYWYFALHGAKQSDSAYVAESTLSEALERVGLAAYRDIPCYQLSAGQQRRVALARLYITQAPVWLLDEPFTAIDKQGVSDLENVIENHAKRDGLVVLTTHQNWRSNRVKLLNLEDFQAVTQLTYD